MGLVPTTFWPYYTSGDITLSNGNLTATITSGTGASLANRPVINLVYFEITTSNAYSGTPRVGFSNYPSSWSSSIGHDVYSIGYDSGGTVYNNNTSLSTLNSWSAGSTICVAINPSYQLVWFNVNGGFWNSISNASPATNTEGISISSVQGASFYPAIGATASASFTANFGGSAWLYTCPLGYYGPSNVTVNTGLAENSIANPQTSISSPIERSARPGNDWGGIGFTSGNAGSPLAANVAVSGSVDILSSPAAKLVTVYDQKTGQYLGSTVSNVSTGDFSLLCNGRGQVFVVAQDPTTYQALIYDNITPG